LRPDAAPNLIKRARFLHRRLSIAKFIESPRAGCLFARNYLPRSLFETVRRLQLRRRPTATADAPRGAQYVAVWQKVEIMLWTVILIIVILLLIGALPTWPYSGGWGYYPSGGLGLILVIIILVLLLR
jgi:sterol desaturase/sphingolipid hydroxylase (fatty acid hydroxylase superfamily)